MKVEIIEPPSLPALKPGQLWQNIDSGIVYLAVRSRSDTFLINTESFGSRWADVGFNGDENRFKYVGKLKVTK